MENQISEVCRELGHQILYAFVSSENQTNIPFMASPLGTVLYAQAQNSRKYEMSGTFPKHIS